MSKCIFKEIADKLNKHNLNYITIYHKDPIDLITNSLAI